MRALIIIALIFAFGCGDAEDVEDLDAAAPIEDAEIIDDEEDEEPEDPRLPGDGGDDGGDDDKEEDPEPSKPWRYYLDGDECDLVSQNCPFENQTCVRLRLASGWGSAVCVSSWGSRDELSTGFCERYEDGSTNCRKGMVCTNQGACRVPCDPDGEVCPDARYEGYETHCVDNVSYYSQPTCQW